MSKELDAIEKVAREKIVSDRDAIEDAIRSLLSLKPDAFDVTPNSKAFMNALTGDISSGFALEKELVKELDLAQILTIIGYEPGVPWFEIDENWFRARRLGKGFFCAPNCYMLARALYESQRKNPVVARFMKISFTEFVDLACDRIGSDHIRSREIRDRERSEIGRMYRATEERLAQWITDEKRKASRDDRTMKEVIDTAMIKSLRPWLCGTQQLAGYMDNIIAVNEIAKLIFMDCIRQAFVKNNRMDFRRILDRCSSEQEYDQCLYDEVIFYQCYE